MGLPQDDPKAYEQSSAINFSSGLRGDLLVMHGSGDDNVHFQGFELLVTASSPRAKSSTCVCILVAFTASSKDQARPPTSSPTFSAISKRTSRPKRSKHSAAWM
jgi:hypothetical protein